MVLSLLITSMSKNKLILIILLLLGAGGFLASANAQDTSSCQQIYGGGETCIQKGKVILNKTIQHPKTSKLVDSLSAKEATFQPGQTIIFHLTVTNTDTQIIKNIAVSDQVPQYLVFSSGQGEYNATDNTFSFTINKLNPGESQTRIVVMKALSVETLPQNQTISCTINQARAISGTQNISEDNAQLCIQTKVLGAQTGSQQPFVTATPMPFTSRRQANVISPNPTVFPGQQVTKTPATGPEALALIALLPAGLAGLLIRRLTSIKNT